ncbi:hypothetical protein BZG36_02585 [Bifiguratus adelaidae]|uniref:Protein YOP1 n=1 Tax=Bifiguratus adelaidae TaxID=1938954 RepID=A0A261Y0Z9_9FUNG|nr:hypothetical protein BZG36_02585 [Bifiguratus adelaidae]
MKSLLVQEAERIAKLARPPDDATPTALQLQDLLEEAQQVSPVNVTLLVKMFQQVILTRLTDVERQFNRNFLYRFFLRIGIPATALFSVALVASSAVVHKFYNHTPVLFINALGVLYPAYRSLKVLQESNAVTVECLLRDSVGGTLSKVSEVFVREQRQWLTYWILFGGLTLVERFTQTAKALHRYRLVQIFVLYWAQNDRSRGASLIYEYLLQPLFRPTKSSHLSRRKSSYLDETEQDSGVEENIILSEPEDMRPATPMTPQTIATDRVYSIEPHHLYEEPRQNTIWAGQTGPFQLDDESHSSAYLYRAQEPLHYLPPLHRQSIPSLDESDTDYNPLPLNNMPQ